jgi:hypothetical protein
VKGYVSMTLRRRAFHLAGYHAGMPSTKRPPLRTDAARRTFDEARIVDHLALCGWSREIRRGSQRASIERECSAALDAWTRLGLPYARLPGGARGFDPVEVINMLKWAGACRGDPFYEHRYVANGRSLVRGFRTDAASGSPPTASERRARRFELKLTRTFDTRYLSKRGSHVLRMPVPIESANVAQLSVECRTEGGVAATYTTAPGRVDACLAKTPATTVELTMRATLTSRPLAQETPAPLPDRDRDLYTRPEEGFVRCTARVRHLAETLATNAHADADFIQRAWNFMLDELWCGAIDYEFVQASDAVDRVLETGWFDCQLGSALLIALCRARGIPARMVGGLLLYPASPSHHWWVEAWLPDRGWIALDTVCTDLSLGGRDIEWRECFFGTVDHRVKFDVLPRLFSRSPGLSLPPAWRVLARADAEATEISLYSCEDARPVYRDRIVVCDLDASAHGTVAAPPDKVNAAPL